MNIMQYLKLVAIFFFDRCEHLQSRFHIICLIKVRAGDWFFGCLQLAWIPAIEPELATNIAITGCQKAIDFVIEIV